MDEIDFLLAKGYVWEISKSMEIEIERIQKHRPDATNYIEGMTKHIGQMEHVMKYILWAKQCNAEFMRKAYGLSIENAKLTAKIKVLEEKNKRLFDGI
jgi:hypothetical protein